jgi:hypothetical protein
VSDPIYYPAKSLGNLEVVHREEVVVPDETASQTCQAFALWRLRTDDIPVNIDRCFIRNSRVIPRILRQHYLPGISFDKVFALSALGSFFLAVLSMQRWCELEAAHRLKIKMCRGSEREYKLFWQQFSYRDGNFPGGLSTNEYPQICYEQYIFCISPEIVKDADHKFEERALQKSMRDGRLGQKVLG